MITRTAGAAALLLATTLMTACGSDDSSSPASATVEASSTFAASSSAKAKENARGAIEVDLGTTAVAEGITISDTSLSAEGCKPNTDHPAATKQLFKATIQITKPSVQWLWPSEFYYVDSAGKITKQTTTYDLNPCSGSIAFVDIPANSSADGAVSLDIPNSTTVIGYHSTLSGDDVRVEWRVPAAPK